MAEITAVLLNFFKAIGKYRWYAVVITWTVALIGWAVVLRLPNQYDASARFTGAPKGFSKPHRWGRTPRPNRRRKWRSCPRPRLCRPTQKAQVRRPDRS